MAWGRGLDPLIDSNVIPMADGSPAGPEGISARTAANNSVRDSSFLGRDTGAAASQRGKEERSDQQRSLATFLASCEGARQPAITPPPYRRALRSCDQLASDRPPNAGEEADFAAAAPEDKEMRDKTEQRVRIDCCQLAACSGVCSGLEGLVLSDDGGVISGPGSRPLPDAPAPDAPAAH